MARVSRRGQPGRGGQRGQAVTILLVFSALSLLHAARRPVGMRGEATMTEFLPLLSRVDQICADFAAALQASQLQLYPAIALAVIVAFMLSSQRDPDRP